MASPPAFHEVFDIAGSCLAVLHTPLSWHIQVVC